MPESAVRFTVADGSGLRAATWKCWTPSGKEDVYLACRELGGTLKTSLHQSGEWHTAYFADFYEGRVPEEHRTEEGRFIDKWSRPTPIAPGVTLAFRVVTPWTSVATREDVPQPVFIVPPASVGNAIEFDVFLVDRTTPVTGWPGKNKQNTKLVGYYELPNGASVWIVWWEVRMPDLGTRHGTARFYRGSGFDDLKRGGTLRMLTFGDETDGSRVIYDCIGTYEGSAT